MVLPEERMATDPAPGIEAPEALKERQVILRGEQIHDEGQPGGAIPIPRQLRVGVTNAWWRRCPLAVGGHPTGNRDPDPEMVMEMLVHGLESPAKVPAAALTGGGLEQSPQMRQKPNLQPLEQQHQANAAMDACCGMRIEHREHPHGGPSLQQCGRNSMGVPSAHGIPQEVNRSPLMHRQDLLVPLI